MFYSYLLMHLKTKPIIPSDVTDVIWCVYLNFHEIDNNSQKFYPENLTFYNKGFYKKIFYYENLEPYDTGGTHRITLPDHFFHLYLQWWKNSLVTWSV